MTALQERTSASGGCLCGAVRYEIRGPLRPAAVACHCTTCRKFTGGAVHSRTSESADYWSFDPGIPRRPGPSGLRGPEGQR